MTSASTKSDTDDKSCPSMSSASSPNASSGEPETPKSTGGDPKEVRSTACQAFIATIQPKDILWRNEGQVVKFHHEAALPLLLASPAVASGWARGQFRLVLQRATLHQPFGITFLASVTGRTQFLVAEDLPHLELQKGDELANINQAKPANIHDVRKILKYSLVVELTLQRQPPPKSKSHEQPSGHFACCAVGQGPPVEDGSGTVAPVEDLKCKPLLSMLRPQVTSEEKGEFRLVMQRSSLAQHFGLDFTAEQSKRKSEPMLVIPADQPHLGLRKGDRLVSINGAQPRNLVHCRHIYENSMNITLVFRRSPRGLMHLAAMVERIEEEPPVASKRPSVEEFMPPARPKAAHEAWLPPWLEGVLACGAWGTGCHGATGQSLSWMPGDGPAIKGSSHSGRRPWD